MNQRLPAADPTANAAVLASAGTGKTWLLVTRLVRLLLAGARPEGILAITFTRKAAAEMLTRLNQRLRLYAHFDDRQLTQELEALGAPTDADHLQRARALYERMLFAERPLRATTFHAFCQEVLQRFPLEADIPPDFELLDTAGLLEQQAWDALHTEATRNPDSALAAALETLLDRCGGLHNTQSALASFLGHRSDWWAFTENWDNPVAAASERIAAALEVSDSTDPLGRLRDQVRSDLSDCLALLRQHGTATNHAAAESIQHWLDAETPDDERYAELRLAFFTQQGERRKRKPSGAQRKSLGEAGEQRLLQLHEQVCDCIEHTEDLLTRLHSLAVNRAWYCAGARLIEHFQRIKREQRFLDFTDLEWRTYRLLNRADNAQWVQYKLDQRIDHLLIDEFQDTNPTQWRLLTPLLEELAAGGQERPRSVFLVGDDKQSIYRFRRAEPQLLGSAAAWLETRMGARTETLEKSWRSSPAIIDCVNAVFEGPLSGQVPTYRRHDTHRAALWGAVEIMPLAEPEPELAPTPCHGLRNPLLQPRQVDEDRRHYLEGRQVAARIAALVAARTPVQVDGRTRALGYDDIYILMRKRTHAGALEQALREAGIPYLGADRGTLLDSLEVSDMEALLSVLTTPYDNLSLAQVLRAPMFACSDADLLLLTEHVGTGTWRSALQSVSEQLPVQHNLTRAQRLLSDWENLAGRVPVHDLLDRIYHEGNIPLRYEAAYPQALRMRVRANLARFISLALEVDSGRYPSLPHFIARLRQLRRHSLEAPDEPPSDSAEARVRLITVHGAKGLEAPVVFLVDGASPARARRAYNTLVHWPPGAERPKDFVLTAAARRQDSFTRELLQREQQAELREDRNLLYVALTRARQYLFVSASAPRAGDLGWYGHLRDALATRAAPDSGGALRWQVGEAPLLDPETEQLAAIQPTPDRRLGEPFQSSKLSEAILPSAHAESSPFSNNEEDGRPRGIALHRMLELLSSGAASTDALRRAAAELELPADAPQLLQWLEEAQAVLAEPALAYLYTVNRWEKVFNEVPLQFSLGGRAVSGVIDRLLVGRDEILIIDYKSHRADSERELGHLTEAFGPQMRLYADGVQRLWPQRRVRSLLLFTHPRQLREVHLE